MIQDIYENYHIRVKEFTPLGPYNSFWVRNKIYVLLPTGHLQEEVLVEMKKLSDYMNQQGDITVATFVPNVQGYYVSELEETNYCLFKGIRNLERNALSLGSELSLFHKRGAFFSEEIEHLSRIGEWKSLWEKRLDQLEHFWQSKMVSHPTDMFEQLFIESFPYYLGLAENAIQYVVDTELDDVPQVADAATICQERFTPFVWQQTKRLKLPVDWVYDHPSRDLAEWVRHTSFEKKENWEETIVRFLSEYERNYSLSSFGWRLLFARLLFPLHYFETVEGYYLAGSDEQKYVYQDKLETVLQRVNQSEQFFQQFYDLIRLPIDKLGIRKLDWLT
ncbi:TPA: spore coat protein YutH [Bacillus pseudomycoides]|nr:spore coat protein YutH [Bacillus pseudomycoides]